MVLTGKETSWLGGAHTRSTRRFSFSKAKSPLLGAVNGNANLELSIVEVLPLYLRAVG
jgi:hypothetical protein